MLAGAATLLLEPANSFAQFVGPFLGAWLGQAVEDLLQTGFEALAERFEHRLLLELPTR
ncbi:MAG: hypothetical protein AW10_00994 [Candidatus Accumulibacter appositus]|uniref:Uncharacterized protein n=1 Tax=Candidatus Accumulibacter appositus TaxID=1454003 RepID=A0A011PXB7_9PROT|nr:MAG: hypothetical protein AW10_00994 [Candidatus Accumulibacter appositus]